MTDIEVKGQVGQHVIDLRDEITHLRAENEGLRDALDHISEILDANAVWLNETAYIIAHRLHKLIEAALKGNSE